MIDPALAARLAKMAAVPPVELPVWGRPSALALATEIRIIRTEAEAERMAADWGRLGVRFAGLHVEYQYGAAVDDGEDDDAERSDTSRLKPVVIGVTPVMPDAADNRLLVGRYAVDVRGPDALAGLARVLRFPTKFIVHSVRAVYLGLHTCNLPRPKAYFSTALAGALLELGKHHRCYENPAPRTEQEEMDAGRRARDRRRAALTLPALTLKYGVPLHVPGLRRALQVRLLGLAATEAINATDAEEVCNRAVATAGLYLPLRLALAEVGLEDHYDRVELPAAPVFADIEYHGVTVDREEFHRARQAAERAVEVYRQRLVCYGFNPELIDSFDERVRVFHELRILHHFRTRNRRPSYSFDKRSLEAHRALHPAVEVMCRYARLATVLRDRMFDDQFIGADGRIHAVIDPLGCDTGRPSFSKPNVVGVPRFARPAFTADSVEYDVAEIDYTCQEIFVAADEFDDPVLLADVNAGDPYVLWAKRGSAVDLPPESQTLDDEAFKQQYGDLRDRWKPLVLAPIYGQGAKGMATRAGVSVTRAREVQAQFFGRYHRLRDGLAEAVHQMAACGYVETATGMRRFRGAGGQLSPWERRIAVNTRVQGGAAAVLKVLLPRVARFLAQHGGRILLPAFDSLVIQYPSTLKAVVIKGVRALMLEAMQEIFPGTQPRVEANAHHPRCWNKFGPDSIRKFAAEVEAQARALEERENSIVSQTPAPSGTQGGR